MNAPEFFDCDFAQELLEKECDSMPREFTVVMTGWCKDDDVYYARWKSEGESGEEWLAGDPENDDMCKALERGEPASGVTAVWFNEGESGRGSAACHVLDAGDMKRASRKKIKILDKVED